VLEFEVMDSFFKVLVGESERAAFVEPEVELHGANEEGQEEGFEEGGEEGKGFLGDSLKGEMRFVGNLGLQLCVVLFVLELAFGLLNIDMLNIFELLVFQKKIFYFPEITDDNLRFRVHPSVITVEQLAVVDVNAL
jgi:hypothetical protein